MKIGPIVATFWMAALIIGLFQGALVDDGGDIVVGEPSDTPTADSVLDIILNPTTFFQSDLGQWFITLLVSGAAIFAAAGLLTKSDMVLLFPVFTLFLALIIIPLVTVYSFVNIETAGFVCAGLVANQTCTTSRLISALLVGMPTLFYFLAVIEWWTGRRTN